MGRKEDKGGRGRGRREKERGDVRVGNGKGKNEKNNVSLPYLGPLKAGWKRGNDGNKSRKRPSHMERIGDAMMSFDGAARGTFPTSMTCVHFSGG